MSRLRIKPITVLLTISLCAILFFSCGFVDLRPVNLTIYPDKSDSLLNDALTPLIFSFDTRMNKNDAEGIVQVSSDTGTVKGDFSWIGNNLYFTPVPAWTAGIRYTLGLSGTIRSDDGREIKIDRFISFYAINRNGRPVLERHFPADGESVSAENFTLELRFSRSMDRLAAEAAVTLDGIGSKTFEWSNDDRILIISTDKALSPWTSYKWSLRDSAKSTDGTPLPKTYSGSFTTDIDRVLPYVTGVYPIVYNDGEWHPTGANIETGLARNQSIAVVFNKPMGESALRSVRFEPSLSGRMEFLDEKSIVYLFTKEPEPQTSYTLIVSAETKDAEGLKIGAEYRIGFLPDIPLLDILSIAFDGGSTVENIVSGSVIPVRVSQGTGELFFSIRFSLSFNSQEKQNSVQRITLSPFFPRTLFPVALQFASWISDDRLYMRWEGLSSGNEEIPHYYKLTIPGGKGGISNGAGYFMNEDAVFYLEAINENQTN
jgi:hypothetical protein